MTSDRPRWWQGTRGEWWVVGQGILMATLVVTPPRWTWSAPSCAAWIAIGAVLVLAGLGMAVRAMIELGPSLTALPRPRRRAVLVDGGLYARARHPIYGGVIIAAFGWALWRASGLHLVLAAALTVYMDAKASHEEVLLVARFPEYEDYRRRTPRRLIPRIL
jgi:protein-S-isoprenylcysteine O-methyltransferase Ste14